MNELIAILSVDWEPNHDRWQWRGTEIDYGGILKGTPVLCDLLDDLGIPCTWFVESSCEPRRDLPALFPDIVRQLAQRKQDEIGLHIHWRRRVAGNSVFYETSDVGWVNTQLDHGVCQLDALGARPRAFRSGALLHVTDLPRLLSERGFLVDSSILWGKANRLKSDKMHFEEKPFRSRVGALLRRTFGPMPDPYFPDSCEVEQRGTSGILEFPITYSLFDAKRPAQGYFSRYLKYKALLAGRTQYLMLFFHIDELTRIARGPDSRSEPDTAMLRHFRAHLMALQTHGAQFLTCSAARSHWLREGPTWAHRQPLVDRVS